MKKNNYKEMIESKVGSTLTETKTGLKKMDFILDITMKEGDRVYTMRKKTNDPMKLVVLNFFNDLCGRRLSEQERDDFYFNYVVPNGLEYYVGELVNEMEQIIKNS